jgi:hypothetical protein
MKLKKSSGATMNKAGSKMNEARDKLADQIRPKSSNKRNVGMIIGAVVTLGLVAWAIMSMGSGSSEEDW